MNLPVKEFWNQLTSDEVMGKITVAWFFWLVVYTLCLLTGQMEELEMLAQESSQVRDELDILRHTAEKVVRLVFVTRQWTSFPVAN